ncbi:hypothetical protein PQR64_35740 [Paraburkholderia phytofirmans]|uniref:hypothetical protein n=1 Tax=Paraburkholderia phytofirmans TaxID=261302 RepID=UPI0038B91E28
MKKMAIAVVLMIASGATLAFDVDGYRSGMTPGQVAAMADRQGLDMWQMADVPGDWAIGIRAQYRIDATFAFCAPAGLFAYAHSLDPDNAYLPAVERTIAAWGQPKVSVQRVAWSGPGGGDIQSIDMLWKRGDGTELSISFTPEGRDGAGALRYNRGTSISYIDRSRVCPTH